MLGTILTKEQSASNLKLNDLYINLKISDHMKKHKKPISDLDFGYYLAGLIEGNGYFGDRRLEIIFHERDKFLAYFIKKRIGYGSVYKINNNTYRYCLRHQEGLKYVLSLVNGKFLTENKINQLIKHKYDQLFKIEIFKPSNFDLTKNYWLAGFSDADSCFFISIKNSKTHKLGKSIQLEYKLKQKDKTPLSKIQNFFSGNIHYYLKEDIFCYNSSSNKTNFNFINYFDIFHLNSSKYIEYFKWRKVYRMMIRKEHLTDIGFFKIFKIKGNFRD